MLSTCAVGLIVYQLQQLSLQQSAECTLAHCYTMQPEFAKHKNSYNLVVNKLTNPFLSSVNYFVVN